MIEIKADISDRVYSAPACVQAFLLAVLAAFLLTGCSYRIAKAAPTDRTPSYAIPPDSHTSLARALAPRVKKFNNMSGFKLLETGSESFAMRLALIEAAEKTIDLQYYAIHDDTTANLLLQALIRATQRGVRVRFLMDAITLGEVDTTFNVLNGLPHMEVRVFNPLTTRKQNFIERTFTRLTNLGSLNRRMHNKALIADNQLAIMGGRNLGDAYFEKYTDSTFKDIDILAAGPIAQEISQSFDQYWNNENTITFNNLEKPTDNIADIKTIRGELAENWKNVSSSATGRDLIKTRLADKLINNEIPFYWSYATMNADHPEKIDPDAQEKGTDVSQPLLKLDELINRAGKEFIIVSPYFVPTQTGVAWLSELEERGIEVRVLTNSLASTDIVAVHTGYENYRRPLLKAGVEIFEMKTHNGAPPEQRIAGLSAPAQTSLHSKIFVIDRHDAMIGSFNLDPRSIDLNTEAMLSLYNPAIARQLVDMFNEVTKPANSYHVVLGKYNRLLWITKENGKKVIYNMEPDVTFARRIQAMLMDLLPIERFL